MGSAIQVRAAIEKDAQQIAGLSSQLGYTLSVDDTMRNIIAIDKSNFDMAYVAVMNGQVVGWIHVFYTMRLETGPFCEIGGLVVDAGSRGKGIGRQLVEKAKKWAAERNSSRLRVRCQVKRTDAHAFYTRTGFEEKKEQKVFEYIIPGESK
ncbi:MAG TPA: GNAT family N-acetyltransferase [Chitinophaga sp.]|uniref:GNAT family N-acetyltransferase n=1 Tax=Chitinophaga sp. TaxID=1869181 RepID=UPI002DBF8FEE|nr:GNAT family N-acetyltransferase [Chitinophaga sp.]HEU4555681.1 GNAT family N-acetyltransferase [Chitinophaga sp.]